MCQCLFIQLAMRRYFNSPSLRQLYSSVSRYSGTGFACICMVNRTAPDMSVNYDYQVSTQFVGLTAKLSDQFSLHEQDRCGVGPAVRPQCFSSSLPGKVAQRPIKTAGTHYNVS